MSKQIEEGLKAYAWSLRDEGQYEFMARKYQNRQKLADEYDEKRKLADKSETINGAPNPQYPRLRLEADMAQMRYEMAYIIDKNTMLAEQVELLSHTFQRVDLLEGAYGHMKMLAENARIDYGLISEGIKTVRAMQKEQECLKTSTSTKPSDTSA